MMPALRLARQVLPFPVRGACALLPMLLLAVAGGCALDPARDAERALAPVPSKPLGEARALESAGRYGEAAEAYLDLAGGSAAPARQQLEIEAAQALLDGNHGEAAGEVLAAIDAGALGAGQRQLLALLQADLALHRGRAAQALSRLERVRPGALPSALEIRYYGTLAAARRLARDPLQAAEALARLDPLLPGRAARLDNQISLLFTLSTLGPSGLAEARGSSGGQLRGWVELAELFGHHGAPTPALEQGFQRWRSGHRGHPALAALPQAYFAVLAGGYQPGTEVVALLPRGGRFGVAGEAVRDGIRAAHEADRNGARPALRFVSGGAAAYSGALEDGADRVIGPLEKSQVSELAGRGALPVPTLALNRSGDAAARNLYQFSLAPEDEAVNAADYAWASGLRSAALLYPQNAWGARMAQAFRVQWRALGGSLGEQADYSGKAQAAAASLAGSDADLVFVVATAAEIAAVHDALRAAGVQAPLVATSHVYRGEFDPARDASLAGLYFVDIPWMLAQGQSDALSREALGASPSEVSGPLARLYAMGIDAYRLPPRLQESVRNPGLFFPGKTGGLTIDRVGQVRRQLLLVQFTPTGPELRARIGGGLQAAR